MTLNLIHSRVADSAVMFLGILAVWALFQRLRSRPLDGNWYGAAIMAEILLLVQFGLGWILYFQGFDAALPRPFMHILYGVVAIISLPAGYAYFSRLEDEKIKALALGLVCLFLWGILLRANQVVTLDVVAGIVVSGLVV